MTNAALASSRLYWQTFPPVSEVPHWPEQQSEKTRQSAPVAPHPFAEQMRAPPSGTQKPEQQSVLLSQVCPPATHVPVPPFPPVCGGGWHVLSPCPLSMQ